MTPKISYKLNKALDKKMALEFLNVKAGDIGFKNVILSILVMFLLIYLPIRVDNFSSKISNMKTEELTGYNVVTKISTPFRFICLL